MHFIVLAFRLLLLALAIALLWFLAFEYFPADPLGFRPPFALWVMDTINLFIHEAGHFFFRPFGQTLSIAGGSLMQCLISLALAFVTWREKPGQLAYPLFWFGENLVNVSVYIADAPQKNLKLIKEGLIHDWHWLLADHLALAEPVGEAVRWLGLTVCAVAVVLMTITVVHSVQTIRKS
jgi:hypothetical protein